MEFFNNVYSVIANESEMIIKPEDALLNIQIIEAAQKSDQQKRIIQLE